MVSRVAAYRLLAWGLSVAAHAALVSVVLANAGVAKGPVARQAGELGVLTVSLYRSDGSRDPGAADQALSTERKEAAPPAVEEKTALAPQAMDAEPVFPLVEPAEPHYFFTRELAVRPQVRQDLAADFSIAGVPAQTVILRLFINEEGDIDRVALEQSYLPEEMAQRLVDAFSKLRFHPGTLDNAPVKSQMKIEVRLDDQPTPQ